MDTIILQPRNDNEMQLLKDFLENTHIQNRILSEEDKELSTVFPPAAS